MPNWCTNKLSVLEGPKDEKLRFLETSKRLSFNEIIPEPTEFVEDISSSGLLTLWRIEYWGTRSNITSIDIHEIADGVEFYTAWTPPLNIFAELAKLFPELKLQLLFEEPNMNICGRILSRNDALVANYEPEEDNDLADDGQFNDEQYYEEEDWSTKVLMEAMS